MYLFICVCLFVCLLSLLACSLACWGVRMRIRLLVVVPVYVLVCLRAMLLFPTDRLIWFASHPEPLTFTLNFSPKL